MLEQAIVDAAALREAALKNAEQSIIEKYAPQIKEAVESMLNNTPSKMKYEGRTVSVVHEADGRGMVTVSEADGKPFVVKESDLSEMTDSEILQEEEMDMGGAPSGEAPNAPVDAPFAGNPNIQNDKNVNLSIDIETLDDEINIDLDDLERELSGEEMEGEDMTSIGDLAGDMEMEDTGMDDLLGGEEDLGGEETPPEEDLQLQELLDLLSETDLLEEEMEVDMSEQKDGQFRTDEGTLEYYRDMQEAHDAHDDEEDDDLEEERERTSELYETIELIKTQNKELESIVYKLSDKLEETLLSNAKLIFQNRTLCDASLNERQKEKIVEAIAKAESPKEAKQLHETLTTTVGSNQKKGPQSLSESVNRRGNLSGIINRRQNLNESKSQDPFLEKMQRLAGIKK